MNITTTVHCNKRNNLHSVHVAPYTHCAHAGCYIADYVYRTVLAIITLFVDAKTNKPPKK